MANLGAILHPVITLLNADRIQGGDSFDFYCRGRHARRGRHVLAAADAERLRIARAYGVPACSLRDWIARAYGHHADTIQAGGRRQPGLCRHQGTHDRSNIAICSKTCRPGLIPLLELGRAAGLASPVLARPG